MTLVHVFCNLFAYWLGCVVLSVVAGKEAQKLNGIGPKIAKKIDEILETVWGFGCVQCTCVCRCGAEPAS